ncbi:MAG: Trk system potassium uptake protein TrkA [Chlamydiales bacterium]|nr:Trk system potassium uptake protein TrkA [Chlamydiales bacterium]
MNIVIIGAGDIGIHLATIFSQIDYSIVLIDLDPGKLEQAARDLDVATRRGSGTNWELLEELLEFNPDLLIALTNDDEDNLVTCTLAKNLGYPQTIARVRSNKYFMQSRLSFERIFCVDHLIGPEKLTADAIAGMVMIPGSIATERFAHGSIQMRTVKVPESWRKEEIPLVKRSELGLSPQLMVGLIRREKTLTAKGKITSTSEKIIFPHDQETLLPDDEVTFIGERGAIKNLHKFFGISPKTPKSVVIVGGSLIGLNLARTLTESNVHVRILDRDFTKCRLLSEKLPLCTVIHRSGTDYRFLQSEKVEEADFFVTCTRNDEVNFLAATIARDLGCENVISSLSDTNYLPLVNRLGISQVASPRINAANRILSIAREKTIASMVALYNNQAEVMEVKVSLTSKLVGIPIRELRPEFPKDFLIAMIQSRGRVFIADASRVLSPGDTVVVVSSPQHVPEIKKLF